MQGVELDQMTSKSPGHVDTEFKKEQKTPPPFHQAFSVTNFGKERQC